MRNGNRQDAENAKINTDDADGNSWPQKGAKGTYQRNLINRRDAEARRAENYC
jgi:hypothetical protein